MRLFQLGRLAPNRSLRFLARPRRIVNELERLSAQGKKHGKWRSGNACAKSEHRSSRSASGSSRSWIVGYKSNERERHMISNDNRNANAKSANERKGTASALGRRKSGSKRSRKKSEGIENETSGTGPNVVEVTILRQPHLLWHPTLLYRRVPGQKRPLTNLLVEFL
jgi:hypothetical protein